MKNCAHCPYQFNNGTYEYPESACIPQFINEDVFLNEDGCKLHHAELKRLHRLYDAVEDAYCCGFNEEAPGLSGISDEDMAKFNRADGEYKKYVKHLEEKYRGNS